MKLEVKYNWHVFVSHNRKQKEWVRQLVNQWRKLGLKVFFDEDSIDPGEPIDDGIERGIKGSQHIILVISPSAVDSKWVALETSMALIQDPAGQQKRIIPVIVEVTSQDKIKLTIQRLNQIDLTSAQTRREQYHHLLQFLGIQHDSLPSPPPWISESSEPTDHKLDPLHIRREFRTTLTEVICQYYKKKVKDINVLVYPQNMPILTHRDFLPEEPISMYLIDNALRWDASANPSSDSGTDMVGLLKQQAHSPELYDGGLYRFLGITDDKQFQFCWGSYFGFLNTCESLSYELAKAIATHKFAYDIVRRQKRDQYERVVSFLLQNDDIIPARAANDPFDFKARETAFGTCALVIVKRSKNTPMMVLNSRSYELSETPGLLHVIPAGTFQPNMPDDRFHQIEFSLTENLYREFTEELLEDKDLRGNPPDVLDVNKMYSEKGRRFREIIVRQDRVELLYLGTLIDPLNLKPEVVTALLVHEGYLHYVCGGELTATWETGRLAMYDFTEAQLSELIKNNAFVPTGRAHLMLVKKHYQVLSNALNQL